MIIMIIMYLLQTKKNVGYVGKEISERPLCVGIYLLFTIFNFKKLAVYLQNIQKYKKKIVIIWYFNYN